MATQFATADILLKSVTWNIDVIPAELKNTHRAMMKFAHATYVSDVDLTFVVYVKKVYDDTETAYTYTMSKKDTYFKQKLPLGVVAREWRFEITGTAATSLDITEAGLLWVPHPIGGH